MPMRVRMVRTLLLMYGALWLAYRLGFADPFGIGGAINNLITVDFTL